jgi:PhnB protein
MKMKCTVKKRSVARKTKSSTKKKERGATPMLAVHDGAGALKFYAKAFGAKEVSQRIPWEGKIGHVEFEIEGSRLMLADEFPEFNRSPKTLGGSPVSIHVEVDNVDALFDKAVEAGAKVLQQIKDEPYGRICKLEDPFGHTWFFSTSTALAHQRRDKASTRSRT